jgi:glycosyltransferase involved in cell wall biosynthesis
MADRHVGKNKFLGLEGSGLNILFIHQNMPGQFKNLAPKISEDPNNRVVFITRRDVIEIPKITKRRYEPHRSASSGTHHYVRSFENAVLHGQTVAKECLELKRSGFLPDVIVAHSGWGEALFLKDVFPQVPLLTYAEFYYHGRGYDMGFDPNEKLGFDEICKARARNANLLLSLEACEAAISPTHWQKMSHPAAFHDKISVIFDGIDTNRVRPDHRATYTLPTGRILSREDEVVTYVARNLEPYRGFPSFMRALPKLLELRPEAQVLIVGGDEVSYGNAPGDGRSWKDVLLDEVTLPPGRVHFLGKLPYSEYLRVLQVSSAHVYLTRPFILSWSCMEAMSAGCLVIGSATPPVEEVLIDGNNGILTDIHSPDAIARDTAEALDAGSSLDKLRQRARETVVRRYALPQCLDKQISLIKSLV